MVLLLHGAGSPAQSLLDISIPLNLGSVAYLAPEAGWWFRGGIVTTHATANADMTESVQEVSRLIRASRSVRVVSRQIVLVGYSQGGCVVSELLLLTEQPYGGAAVLSGGYVGADREPLARSSDLSTCQFS